MPMLVRKRSILAKIEATYGVDPTPTGAANSILVRDLRITPQNSEFVPRNVVRAFLGNSENLPVSIHLMVEFEVEMAGAGAAGTVPKYGVLLRGCGMSETVNAGTNVIYAPVSTGFESVTIYCNYDGVLHEGNGCRGSVSLALSRGGIPVYRFRFLGLFVPVVDAALPTQDFSSFVKPIAVNNVNTVAISVHGLATAVMQELTLDSGGAPRFRSLPGGTESVPYTDRQPSGSITLEAVTVATKDWWTIAKNATLGAISVTQGIVAGNKVKIDIPSAQLMNPQYVDDADGIQMLQMGVIPVPGASGNDEFTITVL